MISGLYPNSTLVEGSVKISKFTNRKQVENPGRQDIQIYHLLPDRVSDPWALYLFISRMT